MLWVWINLFHIFRVSPGPRAAPVSDSGQPAPAVVVYVKHSDPDSRRLCSITASTQPGTTIRCLHKFVPSTFSEILWRQVFSLEGACLVVSSGEMLELGDREA